MGAKPVKIEKLVKVYARKIKALDGVSLDIEENEIFGLIGPNGAGKTTTIRILATLLTPTSGSVSIYGMDVLKDQKKIRRIISYLPEDAGAYENLTGREYLHFIAGFFEGTREAMVERGIRIAALGERIDSKIKEYSKGMKRRLQIARTLMVQPKLAILDEPTSGLDVLHAHYVRKEIQRVLKETGATAIISSHNLLEVEFLCTRVGLISGGRILAQGTPDELKRRYNGDNLEDVFLAVVKNA
ncbi:MAG: ABC transporter ATP-binding protein [Thermoplasmata archaeon]|nr:ABC transporter ATP-binding protein [Thermoplasmata archaeon]